MGWDAETLRGFAALAAGALVNARAHEQGQAVRARLEALDAASRTLTAELALDQVLQRIVEIAAHISGTRYGALGVVGPDGYLSDFITTGLSAEERERIGALPRGHGLLGLLITVGRPVRLPHITRDPRRIGFLCWLLGSSGDLLSCSGRRYQTRVRVPRRHGRQVCWPFGSPGPAHARVMQGTVIARRRWRE